MDVTAPRPKSREFPVYARLPVEIVSGDGCTVRTADGRTLLDCYGGHAVALFGYRHPELLAALARQAEDLFFQTNLVDVPARRRLIERLADFAPPGLDRVFLVNSGAEANENALRLAFRATGRARVVALEGGFHGRTAAAAAVTDGSSKWYAFPSTPFPVTRIRVEDQSAAEDALTREVAALILEPIQGQQGARDLSAGYLGFLRELTRTRGIVLIADEVQCGLGRSGTRFAFEDAGIVPDVVTLAKGLAGGFPAAAVLARPELVDGLAPGDLGTTFGGGPMACVLAEAVVDLLERPGTLERVQEAGKRLADRCRTGPVTGIQGRGLLVGLRCDRPAGAILPELLARGILAGGAKDPAIVRIMPPLTLSDAEIDQLAGALADIGAKP